MKTPLTIGLTRLGSLLLVVGILAACSDSNNPETQSIDAQYQAVITGVSSNFDASEIALADAQAPYTLLDNYAPSAESDIRAATYGNYFYRIGRFGIDNVSRYSFDTPGLLDWQYSTKDDAGDPTANTYQMVFLNDQKAYLIRYGQPEIWIVNPSVDPGNAAGFKLGEIDLSAYDVDASPNASAAVVQDGRLYVVTQALQSDYSFGTSYLVVIDTATDTEIDIDGNPANGNGMALTVQNPWDLDIDSDSLYVTGMGYYYSGAGNPYNGGIEKISLADFSSELLVDDGGSNENTRSTVLVSATQGYFVAYAGWQNTSLYRFNPSTGDVAANAVTGFIGVDIQGIEISPEGFIWVGIGDVSNPEIRILNPADESIVETLAMQTNPAAIVFSTNLAE